MFKVEAIEVAVPEVKNGNRLGRQMPGEPIWNDQARVSPLADGYNHLWSFKKKS